MAADAVLKATAAPGLVAAGPAVVAVATPVIVDTTIPTGRAAVVIPAIAAVKRSE